MRVIITGASGFIGSNLLTRLKLMHTDVIGTSRSNSKNLLYIKDFKDIPDGDVLVHLSENNDRAISNTQNTSYVEKTLSDLQTLLNKKFNRIIYASSVAIYDDSKSDLKNEKSSININDSYSKIKIFSEKAVLKENGIVLRLSNIYGPGMSSSNVISTIIDQLKYKKIKLNNLGSVRDFIWIDDVIEAFIKAIQSDQSNIYNIGSGKSLSIGELADIILEIDNKKDIKVVQSKAENNISDISLDISRSYNILKWQPRTSIQDGIQTLLKHES